MKNGDSRMTSKLRVALILLFGTSVGITISIGLNTSIRLRENSISVAAITFAVVLWVVYLFLSTRLRRIDFFSPEVVFVSIYLLSSLGQVFLLIVGQNNFLTHLYLPALPIYLLVVILGLFGLLAGLSIPRIHSATVTWVGHQEFKGRYLPIAKLYSVSFGVLVLANMLFVIGFLSDPIIMSMEYVYGYEQYTYGFAYYVKLGARFLILPSFALVAYTGNRLKRRPLWWLVMLPYVLMHLYIGSRGGLIPLILLGLVAQNYGRKRVTVSMIAAWAMMLATIIVLLNKARSIEYLGIRYTDVGGLLNLSHVDWLTTILIDVGVPTTITTNIIRWFPDTINWLYGRSFLSALLNMVPGFFFGSSLNRPFLTMAFLYKDLIEGGCFNPDIGYGFAILAEAYANFGIMGSFVVMMGIGLILKWLYNGIFRANGALRAVIIACYGVTLTSAIMALRGEFLSFLKPTVYGVITCITIYQLAKSGLWNSSNTAIKIRH